MAHHAVGGRADQVVGEIRLVRGDDDQIGAVLVGSGEDLAGRCAGTDLDALGRGLRKALYNFMHGVGLDADVRSWFDFAAPRPTVKRGSVARALGR